MANHAPGRKAFFPRL